MVVFDITDDYVIENKTIQLLDDEDDNINILLKPSFLSVPGSVKKLSSMGFKIAQAFGSVKTELGKSSNTHLILSDMSSQGLQNVGNHVFKQI